MPGVVPLGRLGLYKYVTMDSTLVHGPALGGPGELPGAGPAQRLEILRPRAGRLGRLRASAAQKRS